MSQMDSKKRCYCRLKHLKDISFTHLLRKQQLKYCIIDFSLFSPLPTAVFVKLNTRAAEAASCRLSMLLHKQWRQERNEMKQKKKGSEALHRPDMKDFLRRKNSLQYTTNIRMTWGMIIKNCLNDLNVISSIT